MDYNLKRFDKHEVLARIVSEYQRDYVLGCSDGSIIRVRKESRKYFVGDVVRFSEEKGQLHIIDLVERKRVVEKAANQTAKSFHQSHKQQVLATNVDQIFLLLALDQHFSLAKLERYLLVFYQEEIDLTILLTKKDLYPVYEDIIRQVHDLYPDVRVEAISLYDPESIERFKEQLESGKIGLLLGGSGVGKSSLVNQLLLTPTEAVGAVRKDNKGKHTTTTSYFLYCDALDYYMIDTPGFKGIESHQKVDASVLFEEIVELARHCKFSDCKHQTEPACAVKAALAEGRLDQAKWERYLYNQGKIKHFSTKK